MSVLKFLEENALNIICVYGLGKRDMVADTVSKIIFSNKPKRIVIHIFTEREKPFYLEDFIKIIQTNIIYTLSFRYYDLNKDLLEKLLDNLTPARNNVIAVIDNEYSDYLESVNRMGFKYEVI